MPPEPTQLVKVGKRVREATGYLELGLSQRAIDCLEGLGDLGPFEPAVGMIRGQALWMQERFDEAATILRDAADKFPAPHDREAWAALSLYYRRIGDMDQATENLARARGAQLPRPRHPSSQ